MMMYICLTVLLGLVMSGCEQVAPILESDVIGEWRIDNNRTEEYRDPDFSIVFNKDKSCDIYFKTSCVILDDIYKEKRISPLHGEWTLKYPE